MGGIIAHTQKLSMVASPKLQLLWQTFLLAWLGAGSWLDPALSRVHHVPSQSSGPCAASSVMHRHLLARWACGSCSSFHPGLPARKLMLSCELQPLHEAIKFAICLWGEPSKEVRQKLACQVLSFQDVLDEGAASSSSFQMPDIRPSDLATFVYTSGTTGNPKV